MFVFDRATGQRYKEEKDEGRESAPPPPASPVMQNSSTTEPTSGVEPSSTVDSIKMDYDTYMLNRRPGSTTGISETSGRTGSRYGLEVCILPSFPFS